MEGLWSEFPTYFVSKSKKLVKNYFQDFSVNNLPNIFKSREQKPVYKQGGECPANTTAASCGKAIEINTVIKILRLNVFRAGGGPVTYLCTRTRVRVSLCI